jgi:hypothetical protein
MDNQPTNQPTMGCTYKHPHPLYIIQKHDIAKGGGKKKLKIKSHRVFFWP